MPRPRPCRRPTPSRTARALALLALACQGAPFPSAAPAQASSGWAWPVAGEVITPYRNGDDPYARGQHRGLDIAAPLGTEVLASVGGTVRFAGVAGSSGRTVSVRTADGRFDVSYLHLEAVSVRKGERVGPGQRIGTVGTSGARSAVEPHLHLGVREADERHAYRDPLTLLPAPPRGVRDAPRGAPVPVGAPVRVAPAPEPVRRPAPARGPRGVPDPRPVLAPHRVPVGRRVPAAPPSGIRPLPAPSPRRAPLAAPAQQPEQAPAPLRGPDPVPERTHARPSASEGTGRAAPRVEGGRAGDPNLGWVLACLGLLGAAACIGGVPSKGGPRKDQSRFSATGSLGARARTALPALLHRP